jgi:hypothetical protein
MMLDNTDDDVQQWLKELSIYRLLQKVVQRLHVASKEINQFNGWSSGEKL